jgi:hypothetical protein
MHRSNYKIGNTELQQVNPVKYLALAVNKGNTTEE